MENNKEQSVSASTHAESSRKKETLNKRRNTFLLVSFFLLVIGSFVYPYWKSTLSQNSTKNETEVKNTLEKFIKENLVQPGTDVKITNFTTEGELYKLTVSVGGKDIPAYATKDGKKFFPQVVDLDKGSPATTTGTTPAPVAEATQKQVIPNVELFVMSYCPYGVQAEKGILPVVQKLGSKINFSVKFVDYTLHGKKEFDENLNQYCIEKEEPSKYLDYLACFAKAGDTTQCITSTKIDSTKVASCVASTDKQFKLTENFSATGQTSPFNIYKDLNDTYGVKGSPSLVINGQLLDAGRDSASLLKTICSGFTNQPEECQSTLSSDIPAPGFGDVKSTATAPGATAAAPACGASN